MSNDQLCNRGAAIKPQGRRSIHCHERYCPFAFRETMVRYGLGQSSRVQEDDDQGVDEVDNVLSKPLRNCSPSPIKIQEAKRRKSYTEYISEENNSSSDILAKSLPATLPSHFYYSEGISPQISLEGYITSRGPQHYGSPHSSNQRHISDRSWSQNTSNISDTASEILERQNIKTDNSLYGYITLSVAILVILIAYLINQHDLLSTIGVLRIPELYNETKFAQDLNKLRDKYKVDNDSMLQLEIGLTKISEKEIAGSFIFVYDSSKNNFSQRQFEEFINSIAHSSARFLRNNTAEVRHIVVESKSLDMQDHQDLINGYREQVSETGVMVVMGLADVPSHLAMAFHYYCDEYDPLIKKSAVFFTLDINGCSTYPGSRSMHTTLEKCLADRWKSIQADNIGPLLTRVVSVVIDVTSTN